MGLRSPSHPRAGADGQRSAVDGQVGTGCQIGAAYPKRGWRADEVVCPTDHQFRAEGHVPAVYSRQARYLR